MERDLPKRKSLRLKAYDYSSPGSYFITFCTYNRRNMLSLPVGAIHESPELKLTPFGQMLEQTINTIPSHLHAKIDQYVIMPNHVHLMITIAEADALRAIRESPLQNGSIISKTVGYIKMNASKQIRIHRTDTPVWQRGYYDHVIRNQADYDMISKYISENPMRWRLDKFYTE